MNAREKTILRHLVTSKLAGVDISSLVYFSPADGNIVAAKEEARLNLEAIESLIKQGLVNLWVQDRWHAIDEGDEVRRVPVPVIVLIPTKEGEASGVAP